jgi:hypothetical protein
VVLAEVADAVAELGGPDLEVGVKIVYLLAQLAAPHLSS